MELLERLRLLADPQYFVNGVEHYHDALTDAADEIEQLRAQVKEYAAENMSRPADRE